MPTVAILGGGYAGVRVARTLSNLVDRDCAIILVDKHDCHQLTTRLPHVVGGRTPAEKACVPFSRILERRVTFMRTEVQAIDPLRCHVETSQGLLRSDWLVVAMGTIPDFMNIPGLAEHAMVLKSVDAAVRLRRRLEELLLQRRLVRVIVVGAGYTGTELSGELAEWSLQLRRSQRGAELDVTVVADVARLLPEGHPHLAAIAESVLRKKGVSFILGSPIQEAHADRIVLPSGQVIQADLVVWAARTRTPPALGSRDWARGRDGRISVDPYLRAVGYERIYVAGDDALTRDYTRDVLVPASAQFATLEGDLIAANIAAEISGQPLREFRGRGLGEALSLGGRDAAAEVAGVVLSGRLGWAAKEGALLRYLASLGSPQIAADYL